MRLVRQMDTHAEKFPTRTVPLQKHSESANEKRAVMLLHVFISKSARLLDQILLEWLPRIGLIM